VRFVLVAALVLALAGCKTPRSVSDLSDDAIVRDFHTIVFFREFAPGGEFLLTRWEDPVSYAVVGDLTDRQRRELDDHLADLTRLTGRPFHETDSDDARLIAIITPHAFERALDTHSDVYSRFFPDRDAMIEETEFMAQVAACFGHIETSDETGELVQALVLIPTEVDRFLVRSCIIEEFTQIMGPVNDSDEIKPSIFNDSSGNLLLSDHDELILRILYDDRLEPGMRWPEAEPIVRAIVAELRP